MLVVVLWEVPKKQEEEEEGKEYILFRKKNLLPLPAILVFFLVFIDWWEKVQRYKKKIKTKIKDLHPESLGMVFMIVDSVAAAQTNRKELEVFLFSGVKRNLQTFYL